MQRLLSRLRAWIGLTGSRRADNPLDSDRSESMLAMPHAHQVEHALENLAAEKAVTASQELELQPQWRLVSRDGSTISVDSPPPETKKADCPDCLAGRCDQNPQGCRCSPGGDKATISLERLTGIQKPETPPIPTSGSETNAAMPQAKPQLFEQASRQSPPASFLEPAPKDREISLIRGGSPNNEAERKPGPTPLVSDTLATGHPATKRPVSQAPADELQEVIKHWPRLPRSTRRAILTLVGALSEADSA